MTNWDLLQLNLQFYERITQNAERALAADKLDVKGVFLLASIDELKHPAALAKRLTLPKPTVTFLIKKFEQANYVERKTVASDLRRFEINLTPLGRKVCERGRKTLSDAFGVSLDKLSLKEKEQYSAILQKLAALKE
ncbi:MarR family winged helix-turn-helix transcriptional regulator [Paraburkholderia sp. BCC1885]|jgi:DNA-binding MarR family transcriptional regulator|uniref:MarR family winged helix-turn-helix transcriptional regulator n=1 Tax=Paraburkholderia sp. BCC1885 TaxID=2562669 RepID=UPI001642620F|nr:MarR family transcriptional regulator [Paraburkholderia sp. BCC1885]